MMWWITKRVTVLLNAWNVMAFVSKKSAFEALLNRKQYDAMMRRASKMINPIEDSLRVYVLDDIINIYTWGIGERKEQDCIVL